MARSYEWMDQALCAQTDPDLWFPDGRVYRDAKRICAACPVQQQCEDYAQSLEGDTSHPYRHGAWGGAAPRQRARQARAAGQAKAANHGYDADIARLDREDLTAQQIAEQLGCTQRTVARARKRLRQEADRCGLEVAA